MSGLRVIQPGVLSLVQDLGRAAGRELGLTQGGALDGFAFGCAHRLVNNAPDCAALEIALGGLELACELETTLAVTGAAMPLAINGEPEAPWRSHRVRPGDRLKLGHASAGCRAYLAVAGGFAVEKFFGSASVVVREGMGRALRAGDVLPCAPAGETGCLALSMQDIPSYPDEISLRVVKGYQHDSFPAPVLGAFFNGEYRVTPQGDRMGCRLDGPRLAHGLARQLSEGTCLGAVQVPPDGQPIVLFNDRQTIGGYPKLGAVLSTDLARLGQCQPGTRVRFAAVSLDAAQDVLRAERGRCARLALKAAA